MPTKTRILIVEDEAIIAMDLQETLIEAGYMVISTVASGEEALSLCAGEQTDLVLMDVNLQGELSGIETAQHLRAEFAIPSVLLTAHYDQKTLAAAQRAGIFAYLIKPYDQRELCATLATALDRARNEKELQRQLTELRISSTRSTQPDDLHLNIFTLSSSCTMSFQGKILNADLFPRIQREMLALLLSAPQLRVDREVLEAELWPESQSKQARSSFDATLSRLRKLFNTETGSSAAMELFTLKHSVVAIENCSVDLLHFKTLDEEGIVLRRSGRESEAIATWTKALALWHGEFLSGISCHHNVLAVRLYNTQRVFEIALWLAEAFAARQRQDEQIEALNLALRATPTSERAIGVLYSLLSHLGRIEQGNSLLKQFTRELARDGFERHEVKAAVRRIEQRAVFEHISRRNLP